MSRQAKSWAYAAIPGSSSIAFITCLEKLCNLQFGMCSGLKECCKIYARNVNLQYMLSHTLNMHWYAIICQYMHNMQRLRARVPAAAAGGRTLRRRCRYGVAGGDGASRRRRGADPPPRRLRAPRHPRQPRPTAAAAGGGGDRRAPEGRARHASRVQFIVVNKHCKQTNIISIYRKNTHICKYMFKYAEICNLCQNICTLYALWAAKICNVYMQNMQKYAIYMQYICKYIDSICNNVIF